MCTFLIIFNTIIPTLWVQIVNADTGATFTTSVIHPNVTEVPETLAQRVITVNNYPVDSESITVWTCVIHFLDAAWTGDNTSSVDDTDCSDNTVSVNNYTLTVPGVQRTPQDIVNIMNALTNVSDTNFWPLLVTSYDLTSTQFSSISPQLVSGDIVFVPSTFGNVVSTNSTSWVIGVLPQKQEISYIPGTTILNHRLYKAEINGQWYGYNSTATSTVQDIIGALQPWLDDDPDVSCSEDGTKIICIADQAGIEFSYSTTIGDKTELYNTINAEFSDGASRLTYRLNEWDYTPASWTNYTQAVDAAKVVEESTWTVNSDISDAINAINTKKTALESNLFVYTYSITNTPEAESSVDATVFNGKVYVTFVREGNVYFKEGLGTEELVWSGLTPAISVSTGWLAIAFVDGWLIKYTYKNWSSWQTPVAIEGGNSPDIEIDSNWKIHLAYGWDFDWNGRPDIKYTSNVTWSFVDVESYMWWFDWYPCYCWDYFYAPSIKIDAAWNYFVWFKHAHPWSWSWNSCNLHVKSNLYDVTSPASYNQNDTIFSKNRMYLDSSTTLHYVIWNGTTNFEGNMSAWWVVTENSFWRTLADISIGGDISWIEFSYTDATFNLKYTEKYNGSLIGTTPIASSTVSSPVIIKHNEETYIYYIKDGDIKLTSTSPVYTVPWTITNTTDSFVSTLSWVITLSDLEIGGTYTLMSGSTVVSVWVLTAGSTTGALNLNPSLFSNYGQYTLTLSGSYNGTTTPSIVEKSMYIWAVDFQDIYTTIGTSLWADGLNTNLWNVTYANVTAFPWLYFEDPELWKVSFSSSINLTDTSTIQFLQNLPNYLNINDGVITFDPSTNNELKNYGANLQMYFDTGSTFTDDITTPEDFVVKTNTGRVLNSSDVLSNVHGACWVGEAHCTIFFDTSHFTSFDLKPILTDVHITSNNAFSSTGAKAGDTVNLAFTGSENIANVYVTVNGSVASVTGSQNHWTATSQWLLAANGLVTFSIDFTDMAGNPGTTVTATTDTSSVREDIDAPTATISYNPSDITANDVIATLTWASKPITVTNNGWSTQYTFTNNGIFTFDFRDWVGNTGTVLATVDNINKSVPIITLNGSTNLTLEKWSLYTESWATWTDQTDVSWDVSIFSWSIDTALVGIQTKEYLYTNSLGVTWKATRTVSIVDTTPPTVPTITTSDTLVSTPTFHISGTGDTDEFIEIYRWTNIVGTGSINGTGSFDVVVDLIEWANTFTAKSYDISGNYSTSSNTVTITRDTTAPTISYVEVVNIATNEAKLSFPFTELHFTAESGSLLVYDGAGFTGSYTPTFIGNNGEVNITWMTEATNYNYTLTLQDDIGNIATHTGTLTTAKQLAVLEGNIVETGAVEFLLEVPLTQSGILQFPDNVESVILYSNPNDSNYQTGSLSFSGGTVIVNSWTWNGVMLAPINIDSNSDYAATDEEVWWGITIVETIKVWGQDASLKLESWNFTISFYVPWYNQGTTLSLFRSEDGNTWILNTPDASCTLDADQMCTFETDHLSFFAPWVDDTPDTFTFVDITGADTNTLYESNPITVSGINTVSVISIVGGEYKVGTWGYTTITGTVSNGNTVKVRQMSSVINSTKTTATLTIGGVSDSYEVTTKSSSSGGGGWGSGVPKFIKDDCPNGDFSYSYYDKICWLYPIQVGTGIIISWEQQNQDTSLIGENPIENWKMTFWDIEDSPFKDYIEWLQGLGIIHGYSDGTFRPEGNISRIEFLSMVMKAFKLPLLPSQENVFSDINEEWMLPYVQQAYELGIIHWQMIGWQLKFRPNDSISRAEALAILFKTAKIEITEGDNEFEDTDFSDWMLPYVITAKTKGIISGQMVNGKLLFKPNSLLLRGEVAKILYELIRESI